MKHHYDTFWAHLDNTKIASWVSSLPPLLEQAFHPKNNGNLHHWLTAMQTIEQYSRNVECDLHQSALKIGLATDLTQIQLTTLKTTLKTYHPWRKGPFNIHGIHIDAEWHSDWKWDRIYPHLTPLQGKRVLDVGCGNGYHLWRMSAESTTLAVGVDPNLLSMNQFLVLKYFIGESVPAYFLPLTLEQLPISAKGGAFDTVFSMGVFYHRRSPINHIYDLKKHLVAGGEMVLETLVIPEDYGQLLVPENRYAQMRNVWFLPSVKTLTHWLKHCGFENVRCVDLNQTSIKEQRTTEWMKWNSLQNFLDPDDYNKTLEGYPAPLRAVMLANAPK